MIEECPYCQAETTIKFGKRKNKKKNVQMWFCKVCKKKFTNNFKCINKWIKNPKYPSEIILRVVKWGKMGASLQGVKNALKENYQIDVPKKTIWLWSKKLKELSKEELNELLIRSRFEDLEDEKFESLSSEFKRLDDLEEEKAKDKIKKRLNCPKCKKGNLKRHIIQNKKGKPIFVLSFCLMCGFQKRNKYKHQKHFKYL